jgi:CheY-like chemotaxis protein
VSIAPRVLIVDESAESQEVLRELLGRQGALTVPARRAEQAAELARQHRPDLIVYDAESDHSESLEATRQLVEAASTSDTPVIVLGSVRRYGNVLRDGQFVAKPYHYGQLIRRIEDLLAAG